MEKSLLSAEDIFAMKKDGECAIVIKGADPLFQKKCQMENTPFVKLLCRKHNPYDPAKRNRERKLARLENKGFFLSGEDAKEEAKKIRENGEVIIRLTMDDADDLIKAYTIGETVSSLPIMAKDKEMLEENYEKYLKAHSQDNGFDYGVFDEGEVSPEATKRYKEHVMLVQRLKNVGYSDGQIMNLVPLIKEGYSFDEIESFFSNDHSEKAIESFIKEIFK